MACIGKCGIYNDRPKFCRVYPRVHDFLPPGCTFHFIGSERRGSCQPEVCGQNNCCSWPREEGEPEGKAMDSLAGGMPCKHLRWEETFSEKKASAPEEPDTDLEASRLISAFLQDLT